MRKVMCISVAVIILMGMSFAALQDALYDDTTTRLEGEMKNAVHEQGIIAHNIANAETDGYKPIRSEKNCQT